MKRFLIATLVGLAIAVSAAGAGATNGGPLDCFPGCRINVLSGTPTTFPAGQPFTIAHGVNSGCVAAPQSAGIDEFVLEVDGAVRPEDVVIREAFSPPELADFGCTYAFLEHFFVFNFPSGMTGTHTFTGHWLEACAVAVALDGYPGPCTNPAQQVEFITGSVTVAFT